MCPCLTVPRPLQDPSAAAAAGATCAAHEHARPSTSTHPQPAFVLARVGASLFFLSGTARSEQRSANSETRSRSARARAQDQGGFARGPPHQILATRSCSGAGSSRMRTTTRACARWGGSRRTGVTGRSRAFFRGRFLAAENVWRLRDRQRNVVMGRWTDH